MEVCCSQSITPISVHSHVKRPVLAEGKSPFCLVHLHGGAASVQEDSVDAAWLHVQAWQQDLQLAETAQHRRHAAAAGKMSRSREFSLTISFPKWDALINISLAKSTLILSFLRLYIVETLIVVSRFFPRLLFEPCPSLNSSTRSDGGHQFLSVRGTTSCGHSTHPFRQ